MQGKKRQAGVAVVTGAAGGFGREIVAHLFEKGFHVAATDLNADALKDFTESEYLKTFLLDVSSRQDVEDVAQKISNTFFQPISVLVNNAGILREMHTFAPESLDIAQQVLEVNLLGAFNCTAFFGRLMLKKKFGRIINIASIAGTMGAGGGSAYAASKGGLIAATKSWAREMGRYGITVNAIAPGICKTDMLHNTKDALKFEMLMKLLVPIRRLGIPADVAELVAFLASSESNYINGEVITIDGGLFTGTFDDDEHQLTAD